MSRNCDENLIFDYERPGTPTEIRGSFSLAHHGALVSSTDPMDGFGSNEDEDNSSPLPVSSPNFRSNMKRKLRENSLNARHHTDHGEPKTTFYIEEHEQLNSAEQLSFAQEKIVELEKRLEILERELRLSQERAKKLASQGTRFRRMARSGDIFRRAQPTVNHNDDIDAVSKTESLGQFITLTVSSISPSRELPIEGEGQHRAACVPLYMRRFEGQIYAICRRGATIGSSHQCAIRIPEEAGIKEFHASIHWNEAENHFELSRGSSHGPGPYLHDDSCPDDEIAILPTTQQQQNESNCSESSITLPLPLGNQMKFKTGLVEWVVAPLPRRRLIVSRMFDALRRTDFQEFEQMWVEAKSWNEHLHRLSVNKTTKSQYYIDSNTEEDTDYTLLEDDAKPFPKPSYSSHETTSRAVRYNTHFFTGGGCGEKPEKFSLLHVAVDHCFSKAVAFLLEKGAQYGADLELSDSRHLTAVALADTYSIRKLLLSSLMLCAAADGGDFDEVKRLIELGTSPNAKALCHKAPLHLASLNGHIKVVGFLLENKALINLTGGRRNRTALHYASLANDVEIVKILIKYNPDQQVVDTMGYTALNLSSGGEVCRMLHQNPLSLCLASQAGDIEEVRSILEAQTSRKSSTNEAHIRRISRTASGRKVSQNVTESNFGLCLAVDQRNVQGHAPLHLASAAGNLELVQLLVAYGACVDLPGGLDKWTALFYAALAGHSEVVGFLLAIGADPYLVDAQGLSVEEHVEQNIEDLKEKLDRKSFRQRSWMKKQVARLEHVLGVLQSGQQKLLSSLEKKDMQMLQDVLENEDVRINEPLSKHTQTTALCLAAISGMPDFVRILLNHDADPKVGDGFSMTPLHSAAKAGHMNVVQVLLKHGVDINIRTVSTKQTPLHVAAANSSVDVVKLLVLEGADRNVEDTEGRTPFDMTPDLEIKELLATDKNLLYIAIAKGDMNVVVKQIKEDKSISVNITFATGLSPLQVACSYDQLEILEFLISQSADINFQGGPNASSPLHLAVQGKSTKMAKILVENGAKLSSKDADGKTPFEVAKSNPMRKVLVDAKPYKKSELQLCLEDQNGESGSDEDLSRKNLCRICFDNPANTIILPCGHQAFCKDCASHLEMCAFDRRTISQVVTVFRINEQ
eukprot:gene3533-4034_t